MSFSAMSRTRIAYLLLQTGAGTAARRRQTAPRPRRASTKNGSSDIGRACRRPGSAASRACAQPCGSASVNFSKAGGWLGSPVGIRPPSMPVSVTTSPMAGPAWRVVRRKDMSRMPKPAAATTTPAVSSATLAGMPPADAEDQRGKGHQARAPAGPA